MNKYLCKLLLYLMLWIFMIVLFLIKDTDAPLLGMWIFYAFMCENVIDLLFELKDSKTTNL